MNLDAFKKNIRVMRSENTWGRAIIAGCVASIALLTVMAFINKPVITLIPPHLTEEATLHHNKAQAGIHTAWSLFVAETLGNVTPETGTFVRKAVEPLLGPKIRDQALIILERQIDDIKREGVSFSFEPREVQFDEKTGTAYVVGRHYTHQGTGNPERVNRTFEFRWTFANYMPVLNHLDTYSGAPRVKQKEQK